MNGKIFLLAAALAALLFSQAAAQPAVRVTGALFHGACAIKTDIAYPQVSGLSDKILQSQVNDALQDAFLDLSGVSRLAGFNCSENPAYAVNLSFVPGLTGNGLFSFAATGFTCPLDKSGNCIGAHPNSVAYGVTIYNRPGGDRFPRRIFLSDLFKPGSDYAARLLKYAARSTGMEIDPSTLSGDGFYVAPKGLVLLNLFGGAAHAVTVTVPFSAIRDMIDPSGPIGFAAK